MSIVLIYQTLVLKATYKVLIVQKPSKSKGINTIGCSSIYQTFLKYFRTHSVFFFCACVCAHLTFLMLKQKLWFCLFSLQPGSSKEATRSSSRSRRYIYIHNLYIHACLHAYIHTSFLLQNVFYALCLQEAYNNK